MIVAKIVTALLAAWAGTAAFWVWQGRPVDLPPVPEGRFECLSYSPSHSGGSPLDGVDYAVPEELIAADLAALRRVTGCVRTYSSYGVQARILPQADKLGMKVLLGIWIGADEARNWVEIDAALTLAQRHPEAVRAIVVGNEVLLRREMTGERLARIIRAVKARTSHPVTYADIFEFWRRNPVVAETVDFITLHVLPYWDDPTPVGIDEVQGHVRRIIERARAIFPGRELMIGEIGWPSAGRTRGLAVPSRVNQARFVREFASTAPRLGVPYNLIEAIDQPWKRVPEGTVGGFWGILDREREPKFPLAGPVREWPGWHLAALAGSLAAFLAVIWVLYAGGKQGSLLRWLAVAVAGAASGVCLWMLAAQVAALAIGVAGLVWAAYLMAVCGLGGALLVAVCGRIVPDGRVPWRVGRVDPLALCHWAVLLPAAIVALSLAVDGRHRDFLTLAYAPAAVAFALRALHSKWAGTAPDGAAAAWLGAILAVSGPLAIDAAGNTEALAWAGCCLLLAAPLLPAMGSETRQLRRFLAVPGQP